MPSARAEAMKLYVEILAESGKAGAKGMVNIRTLCLRDLYFLLVCVMNRRDMLEGEEYRSDWLFERCREIQAEPDGRIDLWARGHYKSTIITYGKVIQDILLDPEITIGIFSFNRPMAKAFLAQIKRELELNVTLRKCFPSILYKDPKKQAPRWSENDGIIVKRKSNPKESTVEAWGLVDGQPTSRHYRLMVYDDIITRDSVTTPEMIQKVTQAWELSLNLLTEGGRSRYVGTHYHFADTYITIMEKQVAVPRIHPAVNAGGEPVLLSMKELEEKRRTMGPYIFACQMLLNPSKAGDVMGFDEKWLREWSVREHDHLNLYLVVDPAGSKKKKGNDYTVMMVVGLGPDRNYYVVDMLRDRLNLAERTAALFKLHRRYHPIGVGYEQYSMQGDIEHIQDVQEREHYRFDITELKGRLAKDERIARLIPIFEAGRLYLPWRCLHTDYEGTQQDLTRSFVDEEFKVWPYAGHDDMLDCLSRICDEEFDTEFPLDEAADQDGSHPYADGDYNELEYGRRAA